MNSECAREEMMNGWENGLSVPFECMPGCGAEGDLFQEIFAGLSSALPRKSLQTQSLSPQHYSDPI